MYITIPAPYRQAFLAYGARFARQPIALTLCGDTLCVAQMPPAMAAAALAVSAFPLYEHQTLTQLTARHFSNFDAEERRRLVELAHALIQEDVRQGTPASGPRRLQRVAAAMLEPLARGGLDFLGFCRFALPGHRGYLSNILDLAADELLADEEELEYRRLLGEAAQPPDDGCRLHLFFSENIVCHIWQSGRDGVRLLEGGCFAGHEDMLLANVIARRPAGLAISGAAHAPLAVTALLEQVFAGRLVYTEGKSSLDKRES